MTILRGQPGIRVPEVDELLGVSEGTVRNDLNSLTKSGQITRVWDGFVLLDERQSRSPIFSKRVMTHQNAKQVIARQANALVQDNISMILDSSKLGRADLSSFACLDKITRLFTNINLSPAWVKKLEQGLVPFTLCSEKV